MNLTSKCSQVLKLVCGNSCRGFCTRTRITRQESRLRLFAREKNAGSCHLRYESVCGWKYFCSSSSSRSSSSSSSQKNVDNKSTSSSSSDAPDKNTEIPVTSGEEFENLGLIARFKKMYKEYWYVLVPVHLATSAVWFGSFYYASKSGMDIVAIMQSWNFNETLIKPFRDSSLGHVAVAYLLYKIATPARYTITLGATTVTIKHLVRLGYIKPVPTRAELLQIYQDKKESVQTKVADKKAELLEKREAMKEEFDTKKQQIMDDYQQFKEEFKDSMKTVGTVSNPQPPPAPPEEETESKPKPAQTQSDKQTKNKVSVTEKVTTKV